ncbi:MAG: GNAT family N-acetyltransferase [Magnetococcus sp. DMHC-6]
MNALTQIPLKFWLGEKVVFKKWLSLVVRDFSLQEIFTLPTVSGESSVLPPGGDGFFYRSMPDHLALDDLTQNGEMIPYISARYNRYYIDLSGDFQGYLDHFSSKSRATLRRKVRAFAEFSGGEMHWRIYQKPEEMVEYLQLARCVSQQTYQERLLHAGLPSSAAFQEEVIALAHQGLIWGCLLFYHARPIAFLHLPIQEGVVMYHYLGYDPQFSRWSPGTVLQYLVLEPLFAQSSLRWFDFTQGEGAHKQFFSTHHTPCVDLFVLRATLKHRMWVHLHWGLDRMVTQLVHLLERWGVKTRIKRLIRMHA